MEIKWQSPTGWQSFNLADIEVYPVAHLQALFSGKIPVIIKYDDRYVVNSDTLYVQYLRRGRKVCMLKEWEEKRCIKEIIVDNRK